MSLQVIADRSPAEQILNLAPGQYPFVSHYLEHDGARLHYLDEGQGPVLFMLHGNPTWSFLYRKLVLGMRHRFRCVAMDLPGFGLSRPAAGFDYRPESHLAFVVALLRHLDIRDGTLVAHDWGGPIGLAAAQSEQARLTCFVLGNTWAWPLNGIRRFDWFAKLLGGPIGRWTASRYNLVVNGILPGAMRRAPLSPQTHAAYRAPFRHSGDWTGTHVFPASLSTSRDFLEQVEAGLAALPDDHFLFLWPDQDMAFRAPQLERWRGMLPRARFITLADCGHYLWEEAAPAAIRHIAAWHPQD